MPRYKNNSASTDLTISFVENDGLRRTKYIKQGGTLDIAQYVPEQLRHTLISIVDMNIQPVISPVISNWTEEITDQETFIDYTPDDDSLSVSRQQLLIQNETQGIVYVWVNYDFDKTNPQEVEQQINRQIPILQSSSYTINIPSYSFMVRLEQMNVGNIYLTQTNVF